MHTVTQPWDYLIVTASNEAQAEAYRTQLLLRQKLGLITGVNKVLVVADPDGMRIGSGGSTIFSLLQVLNEEAQPSKKVRVLSEEGEELFCKLRILIIHAGGDSRRLPAYGPCGKIFIPVPGESNSVLGSTLFDLQLPLYLELPPPRPGQGQVIVTTGDVFLSFDAREITFQKNGLTGLGSYVPPEISQNHGVFSPDDEGRVRYFLQKPDLAEQGAKSAINRYGHSLLDIGVMNLSTDIILRLFSLFDITLNKKGNWQWSGTAVAEILSSGLDFYRDVCCALGTDTQISEYVRSVRYSGSRLSQEFLKILFEALSDIPFYAFTLKDCTFLHFGTIRQIIDSSFFLLSITQSPASLASCLITNTVIQEEGQVLGTASWVEGCNIGAKISMGGENALFGVDIYTPLAFPAKACLDMLKGKSREGKETWFVRLYGIDDTFKLGIQNGGLFNGLPLRAWLDEVGCKETALWGTSVEEDEKNLWNARLFPAADSPQGYQDWVWMWNPGSATFKQKQAWIKAEKYSFAEMALAADQEDFFQRRWSNHSYEIKNSFPRIFQLESGFSSKELSFALSRVAPHQRSHWILEVLREARRQYGEEHGIVDSGRLNFSRIIHTLGTALEEAFSADEHEWGSVLIALHRSFDLDEKEWWSKLGLDASKSSALSDWCQKARDLAFENLSQTIVWGKNQITDHPQKAVRADEIIWGRAPARLDLGGGWTDTPPYALERGGCVINAAVNLNGQPPIHVYARIIDELEIRISSIDHGQRVTIDTMEDLQDYREATSEFGLAKAALVLSGFSQVRAAWPAGVNSLEDMLQLFGGGIEITTLAAIPSGSGLGTSSIMGAVLISVISRVLGKEYTARELFNLVLQLEQELTTGGGWQDQIGGTVAGVKMITTEPGLIPDPRIHAVSDDILDPQTNNGQTLLYYTGMRRLAKSILRNVVGKYLDREHASLDTLKKLHAYPPLMVDAMSRKDMSRFGSLIDLSWLLNKRLDPDSSNAAIEEILDRIGPYIHGAKLLGAGGGGFLLIVCKSPEAAQSLRLNLLQDPPNPLARFFAYDISRKGLEVTVC